MTAKQQFKEGLITNNPVLVQQIGMCATMAITTSMFNGIGMGLSVLIILTCCNIVISALRKIIPDKVHLPCYITVIAGFVTLVQMIVKAFAPALDAALGVYLPLIVVNCIILGRAEMFACKNTVADSALDGLGMGLGFTLALTAMATLREVIGAGTWLGITIVPESIDRLPIMTSAPGGFFCYGFLMAMVVLLEMKTNNRIERKIGCAVEEGEDN